jgi:hypothetical protein
LALEPLQLQPQQVECLVHSNNNLPSNLPVLEQQLNLLQQVDCLVLPHLLSVQLQHLQQVPLANLNSKPQVLLANLHSKPDPLVCSAQIIKPNLLVLVEVLEQPNRLQPRPVRSVSVLPNRRLLAHLVLPNRPVHSVLVQPNLPLQPRSVLANKQQPLQVASLVLPNKNRPVLGSAPLLLQLRLLVLHLLALVLAPQLLEGLYLETTMQPPSLCLVKQLGPHLVPQIPLVPPGHHPLEPLALEVLKWEVEVLEQPNLKPKHRVNKVKLQPLCNPSWPH